MNRSKEVEYGDWSSLTPLEIAQEVLKWEDDRSALNRKYSQILAKEVERLTIESRVESNRHATIARDNANLRAEIERLTAENARLEADARLGRMVRSDALEKAISESLVGAYFCTRVWEAWGYGTMSQNDFENVDVDRVATEIREALEKAGVKP